MRAIRHEPAMPVRVAAPIRAAILDGTLPPGGRPRQEELVLRLGVARARALAATHTRGGRTFLQAGLRKAWPGAEALR